MPNSNRKTDQRYSYNILITSIAKLSKKQNWPRVMSANLLSSIIFNQAQFIEVGDFISHHFFIIWKVEFTWKRRLYISLPLLWWSYLFNSNCCIEKRNSSLALLFYFCFRWIGQLVKFIIVLIVVRIRHFTYKKERFLMKRYYLTQYFQLYKVSSVS
jgi:hypothetical protein